MNYKPRIEVEPSGAHYLVIGGARYFLGMTKAQADAKMKEIKAQKVRKNPVKKAAKPRRKAAAAIRRKPVKRKATRNVVKRKPARKAPRRKPSKRNPTNIYRLVYYTKGGARAGTGEWNSSLSGIYQVAGRVLNSPQGRSARLHKAEIYYGPRFVGSIDKDGRVAMSKAVGVR